MTAKPKNKKTYNLKISLHKQRSQREQNPDSEEESENELVTSGSDFQPEEEESENESRNEAGSDKSEKSSKRNDTLSFSVEKAGLNEEKLFIDCVKTGKTENDYLTKQDFCYYCKKIDTNLKRHLETKHKDEQDVREFVSYPKISKERKSLIAKIRGKGNFLFNTREEQLIILHGVSRKQFFTKSNIRHHFARCNKDLKLKGRQHAVQSKMLLNRVHPDASKRVREKLLSVMG